MVVISLDNIPLFTNNTGKLTITKFRYLYDNSMNSYYYILDATVDETSLYHYIIVTEGNVYKRLEAERVSNQPRSFYIKKVIVPETNGTAITINDDYQFVDLH